MNDLLPAYFGMPFGMTAALMAILMVSAVMSGLSGFGFSAIGAISLWFLPPTLAVPLLMALSTANQLLSVHQLKADMKPIREWWPDGPGPYVAGGLLGAPAGVWLLTSLPTATLKVSFGVILIAYAAYSLVKPASLFIEQHFDWPMLMLIGMIGGVIGGFTAFPGAAIVIWTGLTNGHKSDIRSIVQPYILALQMVSLGLLALTRPETFDLQFWGLLATSLVFVLPCTLLGIRLYRSMSEANFKRMAYLLLGVSGMGLFAKGLTTTVRTAAALW